jgi:hypothetical protein
VLIWWTFFDLLKGTACFVCYMELQNLKELEILTNSAFVWQYALLAPFFLREGNKSGHSSL